MPDVWIIFFPIFCILHYCISYFNGVRVCKIGGGGGGAPGFGWFRVRVRVRIVGIVIPMLLSYPRL